MVHYLIEGDGAQLGLDLGQRFGKAAGLLFELAVKSNLLLVIYEPGDDSGLGTVITDRSTKLGLPADLWTPVTGAIAARRSAEQVSDLTFTMHDGISRFLAQRAGG
jgi:hypothetical protein